MPAQRKLSARQMELLIEFAENHRDIAVGRLAGGPLGSQATRKAWERLAHRLNAVADGTTKSADQWRRYWIELKAKVKTKASDSRRSASATGGGPNRLTPLTALEHRVLALVGPVAVEGLRGVRIPIDIPTSHETPAAPHPIPSTSTSISDPVIPNPTPPESQMEVEWLDDIPSPLGTQIVQTDPILHEQQVETEPLERVEHTTTESEVRTESRHQSSQGPQHSAHTPLQSSSQRQIRRDERVPRWAYDLETERIAVEQRIAAALEALVELVRQIRDDIFRYTRQS